MYWRSMFWSEVISEFKVMLPSINSGIKSVSSPKLLVRVGEASAAAAMSARTTVAVNSSMLSMSESAMAKPFLTANL